MTNNKILESVLENYNKVSNNNIHYSLFNIIVIAFLKENNEDVDTIQNNKEFHDELLLFVNYILEENDIGLQDIIKQYNK